jgi:hypothetical protein
MSRSPLAYVGPNRAPEWLDKGVRADRAVLCFQPVPNRNGGGVHPPGSIRQNSLLKFVACCSIMRCGMQRILSLHSVAIDFDRAQYSY